MRVPKLFRKFQLVPNEKRRFDNIILCFIRNRTPSSASSHHGSISLLREDRRRPELTVNFHRAIDFSSNGRIKLVSSAVYVFHAPSTECASLYRSHFSETARRKFM